MNLERESLLDPLLPLLGIEVPRRAQPPLVSRDERAHDLGLPHLGDGLVVALRRPRPRVELGPVDLFGENSCQHTAISLLLKRS